ncbi:hypothetical protein NECID01_1618 [Nematocida sp. AWRm77]|nr:hypothetical protein NECID01_1618 [Nematocida sp. AWRm77]
MKQRKESGLSPFGAMFPMISSIMGAGVLNLPQSVECSGYFLSGPILLVIASISAFTLYQLVFCAKQLGTKNLSYFEVCNSAFPLLGYAAELCIGMQGLGCCVAYFLILKDWIAIFLKLDNVIKQSMLYNILFSLGVIAIPAFLASLKDLKKLSAGSFACTVSVLYLSFLVMGCGLVSLFGKVPLGGERVTDLKKVETNPVKLFEGAFGYIFAIGCQQNMVKVFSLLEKKTVKNGVKAGAGAVAVAAFVFFFVANGGYFAGGNGQTKSILDVLEDKSKPFYNIAVNTFGEKFFYLISLAKIGMMLVLSIGYPIQMHPTRDSILTFAKLFSKSYIENNLRKVEVLTTTLISAVICLCSLTEIKYSYVMKIIASTASCYIMYSLPSIAYLYSGKKNKLLNGVSMGILLFSLTVSAIGVYSAVFS